MRRQGDDLLQRLEVAAQRRALYGDVLSALVHDTLAAWPPLPGRALVEIGAGHGQLGSWLPEALRSRCVPTEPAHAGAMALQRRAPGASIVRADAQALPFAPASLGAVLGLCVVDAVDDAAKVATEVARVLAPGGRFLHFLDMATLRHRPFERLSAEGLVPIPNVLSDPAAHDWPLDMLLLPRDRLIALLRFAETVGHPLASTFGPLFTPFLSEPFDPVTTTEAFRAVARHPEVRGALATMLVSASEIARRSGYPPLEARPFHSGRYFQTLVEESFLAAGRFEVEQSAIAVKSEVRPPTEAEMGTVCYRSFCLGHERVLSAPPNRFLSPSPPPATGATVLVEAGMFVFVARRLS